MVAGCLALVILLSWGGPRPSVAGAKATTVAEVVELQPSEAQGLHPQLHPRAELSPGLLRLQGLLPLELEPRPGTVCATLSGLAGDLPLGWEVQHGRDGASIVVELPEPTEGVSLVTLRCEGCQQGPGVFSGELARGAVPRARQQAATVTVVLRGATLPAPPTRRRLLQQDGCSLAVGNGDAASFEGCTSVTAPGLPYKVYYTLVPTSNGTEWRGGLKVDVSSLNGQWAGLGFPNTPETMVAANAVVLKACSSCPSGATVYGCHLKDYVASANIPGSWTISNTSAAKNGRELAATFTLSLSKTPAELTSSNLPIIYAIGPLDAQGNVAPHTNPGLPYGGASISLGSVEGSPSVHAGPTPEMSGPSPATAPAAESGNNAPAAVTSPPLSEAQQPGACELTVGGSRQKYDACTTIPGVGSSFKLLWKKGPSPNNANSALLSMAVAVGGAAQGWAGVGFPATPGKMIGSTAMIVKACAACSGGADIKDYFLAAKDPSAVRPPGRLRASNFSASASPDGALQGSFQVELDASAVESHAFPMIFALGDLGPGESLQYHNARTPATVDLSSAEGGGSAHSSGDGNRKVIRNVHAWLMVTGWGVLIPSGVVIARGWKGELGPLWFQLHRGIQILGLTCALTGFIVIFVSVGNITAYGLHRRLGISAMSLGLFQLSALVVRPHKDSRYRRAWNLMHWWVGRAAVLVAVANIYEGIINVKRVGTWAVVAYSCVFGSILGAALLKDGYNYLQLPPPEEPSAGLQDGRARPRVEASVVGVDGMATDPPPSTGSSVLGKV